MYNLITILFILLSSRCVANKWSKIPEVSVDMLCLIHLAIVYLSLTVLDLSMHAASSTVLEHNGHMVVCVRGSVTIIVQGGGVNMHLLNYNIVYVYNRANRLLFIMQRMLIMLEIVNFTWMTVGIGLLSMNIHRA